MNPEFSRILDSYRQQAEERLRQFDAAVVKAIQQANAVGKKADTAPSGSTAGAINPLNENESTESVDYTPQVSGLRPRKQRRPAVEHSGASLYGLG